MPKDPETGKKYPYTKAGKAAAAAARKKRKKVPKRSGLKGAAKEAVLGGISGAGQGGVVKGIAKAAGAGMVAKGLRKGALKRTPAMIRKQKAAMERAKKKRKAGKGYQK